MPRGLGKIQKKVLVLLAGGLSLSLAGSPQKQIRILRAMHREWEEIDRKALAQAIRALYQSKLVDFREQEDESVIMILNDAGKKKVIHLNIDTLRIRKPNRWDGKWRIVCFDVPKEKKKIREALRFHLKRLGFHQLQKSVFIFPYPCEGEIDFLIEFYDARHYVRWLIASNIDNALHLRHVFKV